VTRLFTVGHGTRSAEELVDVLASASVSRLVDVRRFPGSRRHPQFGRDALERFLAARGVGYEWRGEDLGGRRSRSSDRQSRHRALTNRAFRNFADHMDTPEFRAALKQLKRDAAGEAELAIMCAETLWWRCHRRMISDVLELHGIEVIHLVDAATHQRHRLHDTVRADRRGWPVYDGE
jgi:uncharacterized protein (DUF488 family)